MTLSGECQALGFAVQIAKPPSLEKCNVAAIRRQIAEPRNRGGLVT